MIPKVRIRKFPEHNYWALFHEGTSMRFTYEDDKPITDLTYPEFWDVKVTNRCSGHCPWCYMDSVDTEPHYENIVEKFKNFFHPMTMNQRPFQIAFGGGNPNEHPDFPELLQATYDMGILPNYTTNGLGMTNEIIQKTIETCGGVAVSTHKHLHWRDSVYKLFGLKDIMYRPTDLPKFRLNLHLIISDTNSIIDAMAIYQELSQMVDYFVLLPMTAQGRCKVAKVDSDFLFKTMKGLSKEDQAKFAYGAKFYEPLQDSGLNVNLYEPEIMSKFLDLKDMKIYGSSFDLSKEVKLETLTV